MSLHCFLLLFGGRRTQCLRTASCCYLGDVAPTVSPHCFLLFGGRRTHSVSVPLLVPEWLWMKMNESGAALRALHRVRIAPRVVISSAKYRRTGSASHNTSFTHSLRFLRQQTASHLAFQNYQGRIRLPPLLSGNFASVFRLDNKQRVSERARPYKMQLFNACQRPGHPCPTWIGGGSVNDDNDNNNHNNGVVT